MSLGKLIRPLEEHFRSAFLLWDAYILIDRDKLHCWAWLYNVMLRRLSSHPLAWLYLWFLCVWVALQYVVALTRITSCVLLGRCSFSLAFSKHLHYHTRQVINIKQRIWVEWTGVNFKASYISIQPQCLEHQGPAAQTLHVLDMQKKIWLNYHVLSHLVLVIFLK